MAQEFVDNLQAVLAQLRSTGLFSLLSQRPSWADFLASLGLPIGGDPEDIFKKLVHVLIQHILYSSGNSPAGTPLVDPCSQACKIVTRDLKTFLLWISLNPNRIDVGFGTLMTAFNAVIGGWHIKGIWGKKKQPLDLTTDDQVFLIGFLPKEKSPSGKSIVVAVRGDSCQECGTQANIDDVLIWAKKALDNKTVWDPGGPFGIGRGFTFDADKGAMVIAFTRPGAKGVDKVVQALRGDPVLSNSSVPVIVAWMAADGKTVYYDCVGTLQACSNLSPEEKERIACTWVTGSPTCNAQSQETSSSTTANESTQQTGSTVVAPPPPPAPPSSPCKGPICSKWLTI